MREAEFPTRRFPASLQQAVRDACTRLGAPYDEVASATEDLVRDAIATRFGTDPERVIVEAVVARRAARDRATLDRLERERRPALRGVV